MDEEQAKHETAQAKREQAWQPDQQVHDGPLVFSGQYDALTGSSSTAIQPESQVGYRYRAGRIKML
jgi:hypothetical protein